jgi:hypothetical protein
MLDTTEAAVKGALRPTNGAMPQPYECPGPAAIAALLRDRAIRRGAPLRLVPTRANGQPAFGAYLPDAHAAISRAYAFIVLTLERPHLHDDLVRRPQRLPALRAPTNPLRLGCDLDDDLAVLA